MSKGARRFFAILMIMAMVLGLFPQTASPAHVINAEETGNAATRFTGVEEIACSWGWVRYVENSETGEKLLAWSLDGSNSKIDGEQYQLDS